MRLAALLLIAVASPVGAQFEIPGVGEKPARLFADVGTVTVEVVPAKAKRGEAVTVKITVTPKKNTWTYPIAPANPNQLSKNKFPPRNGVLIYATAVKDPAGVEEKASLDRPLFKDQVYKHAVTWELKAWVAKDAKVGPAVIDVIRGAAIQICNKDSCFNADASDIAPANFEVLDGEAVALSPSDETEYAASVERGKPKTTPPVAVGKTEEPAPRTGLIQKPARPVEEYEARMTAALNSMVKLEVKREGGLWGLLTTAAFWGLVSLATPCVFPMIPITVSLFLKQSNQSAAGAVKLAGVYSLTIVVILGLSAYVLLDQFQRLSINPLMNIGLGVLFVVFAMSLFGSFDITLPNFMLRAAEKRRKQGGMIGTVFGAIAFSIVSFTCVAPFLGGFAGLIASGQYSQYELILAGLTYATAFAAPFFILALFPRLLKALPKSGGWLDSVKVVMGFLEVAAALKFFRTAELRLTDETTFFTYDLVLAGWVVIAVACGLYLLNVFRLPHDEEKSHIGVPRLMFALLFLGFGVFLLPGTFKGGTGKENQRPKGVVFAWVDAFLLPEPKAGSADELPWSSDLPDALAEAKKDPKHPRVFIDFTGVTCSNCRTNENAVFPRPEIRALMEKYTLVQMYTDDVPAQFYTSPPDIDDRKEEGRVNKAFQKGGFGDTRLPMYVILEPTSAGSKVVAVYGESLINNPTKFAFFLRDPVAYAKTQ